MSATPPNPSIKDRLLGTVRTLLKALDSDAAGATQDGAVPVPPPDPDALDKDTRVSAADASPTEADLKQAGADQPAPDAGAAPGGEDPTPGAGEDDEEGGDSGRPIAKALIDEEGFDQFGNKDLDAEALRTLRKAFGAVEPTTPEEALHGGKVLEEVLEGVLTLLKKQVDDIAFLTSEVKKLSGGHQLHERQIAKAFQLIDPRTAVPEEPRAITKALQDPMPNPSHDINALYAAARSGDAAARAQLASL